MAGNVVRVQGGTPSHGKAGISDWQNLAVDGVAGRDVVADIHGRYHPGASGPSQAPKPRSGDGALRPADPGRANRPGERRRGPQSKVDWNHPGTSREGTHDWHTVKDAGRDRG